MAGFLEAAVTTMLLINNANYQKSVVSIVASTGVAGVGSVVEINKKNYILTNYHICMSMITTNYTLNFDISNGKDTDSVSTGIFGLDYKSSVDSCLIPYPSNKFPALKIGKNIENPTIHTFAFPDKVTRNYRVPKTFFNVDLTPTNEMGDMIREGNVITHAKILKGMSGSPVVNMSGEIVGLVWGNNPKKLWAGLYTQKGYYPMGCCIMGKELTTDYEEFNSEENVNYGYVVSGDTWYNWVTSR